MEPPSQLIPGKQLPPPPANKRNRRQRSLQGQMGGGDKKKGKGAQKDQEFIALEKSGAPPFLISKCSRLVPFLCLCSLILAIIATFSQDIVYPFFLNRNLSDDYHLPR